MNDLTSRALELRHAAHELMYLGMDGEPVYSDAFCRLNKEVLVKSDFLFSAQSSDVAEEANICLALLMGYNATIYDDGDKEQKKQTALNRACEVLGRLPASLLKVRLLAYTYGEVYEESLLQEAHAIIDGWGKEVMTAEQVELVKELRNIEENPYPFEEVED
ncbi:MULTISPECIES: UpxZ family transcription anti-terminator antagonist [Bacteroides]|uniref:UpxZ family transcription anti-terminator antagonist n=1 Tax=Bacteroides TaxID=816 RepID=UPI0001BEEDBF|nr:MULTISPECIES: UpxZ family transcription anti-terminator antagonist [Bacteroides]EFA19694.1 hypothetical protein HMPREF0969_02948 [Bacteroides sp. D20]